jgi:hypothetical protein
MSFLLSLSRTKGLLPETPENMQVNDKKENIERRRKVAIVFSFCFLLSCFGSSFELFKLIGFILTLSHKEPKWQK